MVGERGVSNSALGGILIFSLLKLIESEGKICSQRFGRWQWSQFQNMPMDCKCQCLLSPSQKMPACFVLCSGKSLIVELLEGFGSNTAKCSIFKIFKSSAASCFPVKPRALQVITFFKVKKTVCRCSGFIS